MTVFLAHFDYGDCKYQPDSELAIALYHHYSCQEITEHSGNGKCFKGYDQHVHQPGSGLNDQLGK